MTTIMKTLPISRYRFFQQIQPLSILTQVTSKSANGCLQVFSHKNSWCFYLEEGKVIYACCTEQMFEMLYNKLQFLSQHIPSLQAGVNEHLQAIFERGIDNQAIPNPDYLAICWLVNHKYLSYAQAGMLIEELAREVLDSFLTITEGSFEFNTESFLDDMPKFCHLEPRLLIEDTHKQNENINPITGGLNTALPSSVSGNQISERNQSLNNSKNNISQKTQINSSAQAKTYTIVCIDDSPTVINAIKGFLDEQAFHVVGINDPLKALMQILRTKPDLILLDIEMPNLDGYELCSLLRKHSHFKDTPIVMVTGRTGFIDRAKAKMVRASGYLTKPFNQAELLKIVFQHLD
jgi:two-component system, chemotaxis family, response regulator PixG